MSRKYRLRIIQIALLFFGIFIIYYTYYKEKNFEKTIISTEKQKQIKKRIANQPEGSEVFSNIEYAGIDMSGNRYIIKSKKAFSNKDNQALINLTSVVTYFYFKDNTVLKITSERGLYNNLTLDMNFYDNIVAVYGNSKLYAKKAEFSNLNNNLVVSENVKLNDERGIIFADKLIFDIKEKTLNVTSSKNKKINANINIKWKKDLEF